MRNPKEPKKQDRFETPRIIEKILKCLLRTFFLKYQRGTVGIVWSRRPQ